MSKSTIKRNSHLCIYRGFTRCKPVVTFKSRKARLVHHTQFCYEETDETIINSSDDDEKSVERKWNSSHSTAYHCL